MTPIGSGTLKSKCGPATGFDDASERVELVGEARVEHASIDARVDLGGGLSCARPRRGRARSTSSSAARLHHLGEAIEDLPAVVRRAPRPAVTGVLRREDGVAHVLARAARHVHHVGIRRSDHRRSLHLEVPPGLGANERSADVHLVGLVDRHADARLDVRAATAPSWRRSVSLRAGVPLRVLVLVRAISSLELHVGRQTLATALAAEAALLVAAEGRGRVELVVRVPPDDAGLELLRRSRRSSRPCRSRRRRRGRTSCCSPSRRPRRACGRSGSRAPGRRSPRARCGSTATTPVKNVGANQKPLCGSGHGAEKRSPPSSSPALTSSLIFSSCIFELMAPTSVFLSSGSPRRSVAMRSLELADHDVVHALLDEQARAGAADVALVEVDAVDDALDGLIDRRVGEDDVRRLAAELEREALLRPGGGALDALADLGRAGEGDLVDVRGARRAPRRSRPRR